MKYTVNEIIYLYLYLSKVYSLHHNVLPTLQSIPLNDQWASLPDHTGFLLPQPAYNASKPMIISHDQFRTVVFAWMCVCCIADSMHGGSVAVVSGIYYSDHWWLQAYI